MPTAIASPSATTIPAVEPSQTPMKECWLLPSEIVASCDLSPSSATKIREKERIKADIELLSVPAVEHILGRHTKRCTGRKSHPSSCEDPATVPRAREVCR